MSAFLKPDETLTLGLNVIVRPGDEWHDSLICDAAVVEPHICKAVRAPQDWVALTGPCPRCNGHGGWLYKNPSKFTKCGSPDCRDGRRIVPLYRECETCEGTGTWYDIDPDGQPCRDCEASGRVLAGRAAVVSIEPEDDGHNFRIALDVVEVAA